MRKKILISITLAVLLSSMIVVVVMAGATRDRGTLETTPPAGSVNYTAWIIFSEIVGFPPVSTPIHPPAEIMTEDSYNAAAGSDLGYTDEGWRIQVENMTGSSAGAFVNMNFCGLGDQSGKNWFHYFFWDVLVSDTLHTPAVPLRESTNFTAPVMLPVEFDGDAYNIKFFGETDTQYYVYRSQNPATAGSDRSNGRYLLVGPSTTDEFGYGEYSDSTFNPEFPVWYVVMYFDDDPYGPHGCHSEIGEPTAVTIFSFEAAYIPHENEVELEWQTTNEVDILGYNVWRSTSVDGAKTQVNTEGLIEPNPGGLGGLYAFTDDTVERGMTYYYWIEYVETGGSRDMEGPEEVQTWFVYYLPLFSQ